jgi:Bacterial Ig-like domain (group 3)
VSVLHRITHRRTAVVGLGVVAISLFGVTAPAFAAAAPSRTTLSTSTPQVGVGSTAKFRATVKPVTGSAKPAGTVTFKEGATTLGTSTLALVGSSQTAKFSTSLLPAGAHTVIATYNGSTLFATSTSLPITIVVGKADTTTTASTSTPNRVPGQDGKARAVVKQVAGTAKPAGTVTFTEGATTFGTQTLALVGTTMQANITIPAAQLALGTHTITATYDGTGTFAASSDTTTITVTKRGVIFQQWDATPGDPGTGDTTLVVIMRADSPTSLIPQGIMSFVVDGSAPQLVALNANGRAQLLVPSLPNVAHTAVVTYPGDVNFAPATSDPLSWTAP